MTDRDIESQHILGASKSHYSRVEQIQEKLHTSIILNVFA
jgi:hypothetical protein